MSENIRNILLRALFEPEFHNRLQTNVESALEEYSLSDEERRALIKPGAELYGFIGPKASAKSSLGRSVFSEPPTTTTTSTVVAVVIVVAIVAFVAAIAATDQRGVDLGSLQPLVRAIQSSQGPERAKLITTLVNELTREV